jgi:adenosine/AMP kinase
MKKLFFYKRFQFSKIVKIFKFYIKFKINTGGLLMELELVKIENPNNLNLILGHSHFIKTVEDIHEAMVNSVPNIKFGLAFCEASEKRLCRWTGTDQELIELAQKNAMNLSAGHSFIIFLKDCYPINVLPVLKGVPEVCRIICATANPVEVIIAKTEQGRGILGVVDGLTTVGIETEEDIKDRKSLLRAIGYKL